MNNLPIYLFFITLSFHFGYIVVPPKLSFWLTCVYGEINQEVVDMKNVHV